MSNYQPQFGGSFNASGSNKGASYDATVRITQPINPSTSIYAQGTITGNIPSGGMPPSKGVVVGITKTF